MIDPNASWQTERLVAEPLNVDHADELHPALNNEAMHMFTGGSPRTMDELRERYQRLERRHSADGAEVWCNWALRDRLSGALVGVIQSTLPSGGPGVDVAHVAWEIGVEKQRRGYASEAAKALADQLRAENWCVVADIHPGHAASQGVARRAGLAPTERIVDGEVRWWSDPWDGAEVVDPLWKAWTPREVTDRLTDVSAPWCVAAGWALDLFRGHQTREHEDLEIAVPIREFRQIRAAFASFEFEVVGSGHRWPVDSPAFNFFIQTWLRDSETDTYFLDVFREPHDGTEWICRRNSSIRRPYADVIERTTDGIPYLAPEIVLLFKAKHDREKDHRDFEGVLDLLDPSRKAWLFHALSLVHPDHKWLDRLTDSMSEGERAREC